MNVKKLLLGLLPWAVFAVLTHREGAEAVGIAAVVAMAVAGYLGLRDRGGEVKVIDVTGVLCFGLIFVAAFSGGEPVQRWLTEYGRGASAVVLAAVMLISAATVPFSESYAKQTVEQKYWATAEFRSVNRRISALWGGIVLVMAVGHLIAGANDQGSPAGRGPMLDLLLNWAIPVALVLIGVKASAAVVASAKIAAPEHGNVSEPTELDHR